MTKPLYKVVIVGGGYGGVKAALELSKHERISVTLITEYDHMRIYGTLYLTATGAPKRASTLPMEELFGNTLVNVVYDRAVQLDRESHTVKTADGHTYTYNALVLALGVQTNYFNIKGLEDYSFGIKSLQEAERLKSHLHQQMIAEGKPDLNYVVVGGGPTGVELAGALPSYIATIMKRHGIPERKVHIDLVEAAPRLLPRMPKDVSRKVKKRLRNLGIRLYLGASVEGQTADELLLKNKPIRSHTVIWTAGMSNPSFFGDHSFQLTKNHKVRVDQFLQAEPGIYVLGDNADTPYSGMAQTAIYDGAFVASNLKRMVDGKDPRPYLAKKPVYVVPAGPKWAAVLWGPVRVYGRLGWILRKAADFIAFRDFEPMDIAVHHFLALDDQEETCPLCADDLAR